MAGRRYETEEWVEWLLHLQDDNEALRETEPDEDVIGAAEVFSENANRVFEEWAEKEGHDSLELSLDYPTRLGSEDDIALNTYYELAGHGTGFWDELPDYLYKTLEAAIKKDKKLQQSFNYFEQTLMDQAAEVVYEDNPGPRRRKNPLQGISQTDLKKMLSRKDEGVGWIWARLGDRNEFIVWRYVDDVGRSATYAEIVDTKKAYGNNSLLRYETSDGERWQDLRSAKLHALEFEAIPRLEADGYWDQIAEKYFKKRSNPRSRKRSGPGSYPWDDCIKDQLKRYGDMDAAKNVCGSIRAKSRKKYPGYWAAADAMDARKRKAKKTKRKAKKNPSKRGSSVINSYLKGLK